MDEHTDIDTDELHPCCYRQLEDSSVCSHRSRLERRILSKYPPYLLGLSMLLQVPIYHVKLKLFNAPTSPDLSCEIKTIQCGLGN